MGAARLAGGTIENGVADEGTEDEAAPCAEAADVRECSDGTEAAVELAETEAAAAVTDGVGVEVGGALRTGAEEMTLGARGPAGATTGCGSSDFSSLVSSASKAASSSSIGAWVGGRAAQGTARVSKSPQECRGEGRERERVNHGAI